MNEDELKALVDELKASNESLANKNKELLSEVKKERNKSREIDADKYYAMIDELENVKTENSKLQGDLKLKGKEFEKLTATIGEKDATLHQLLVRDGVTKELASLGLDDFDTFMPYFERGSTIENGVAMINGKPIKDAVSEWSETLGKRYIPAIKNSGGGAGGGSKDGGAGDEKVPTRAEEYSNMFSTKQ